MNTTKIIRGTVNSGRYTVTAPIVKEDYGLYLKIEGVELPSTYEVDFSNSEHNGTSVTMIGNADGVLIPHQFIDTGKDVFAFLYHVGADYGRTVYKFRIPNKVRPDRTEETPTPEEQSTIDQLISALNSAVEQTGEDVESASQSAQSAESAKTAAESARDTAGEYANDAESSAASASTSASQASASATASAQSASQSAQIKSDVEDLTDNAQGYADASAQSASASANSASQAQGYAQSASASAQSASGYASQAQTSAQTASSKATEASTSAQTASQKATESAHSASQALSYKTDAESAKTASQAAQGLAESARDSAISAKDDAEQAKADAESARDEARTIVDGISGALDDKADIITDTASGSIASFSDGADDLPLKSLVVDINPIQDLSNGDPSPENICPISGWTSVDVEQSGVNIFDKATAVQDAYIDDGNGVEKVGTGSVCSDYISVVPNTTYYIKSDQTMGAWGAWYDADKIYISGINGYIASAQDSAKTKTAPSNARYMRLTIVRGGTGNLDTFSVNYPSTDHDYHPYAGQSITINLGQTVYGGKLDVLSGELTVARGFIILDGTTTGRKITGMWTARNRNDASVFYLDIPNSKRAGISDILNYTARGYVTMQPYTHGGGSGANGTYSIALPYDVASSVVEANAWLAEHNVTIVYSLATPIEIQLSANQLNSLYGVNNLWADSGDTEVEYRADTKLYINKKIAEAISALS